MAETAVFSPRTVLWLIAVGFVSIAGAAYFTIYGDVGTTRTTGANAFSYSAIGYRAFVETLRRLDVPVVVSRQNSAAKAGESALLIVAEPQAGATDNETLAELLSARTVLLVLPKWQGRPDEIQPRWLKSAKPIPSPDVEAVLSLVTTDGRIRRVTGQVSWSLNALGFTPSIAAPQLIETSQLRPVVASERGLLVGELVRDDQRIWVLSDPDILSNSGLGHGDNAPFALALINAALPGSGAVVVDETIHGFYQSASLVRVMFQFPLVVVTLQGIATLIALILATTGRFGAAIPISRPLHAGKDALLENTACLLRYGGHSREILRRYCDTTLREVVRRLHAPKSTDEDSLTEWVDRVGQARGVGASLRNLRFETEAAIGGASPNDQQILKAAQNLCRWKQEILDGP